MLDLRVLQEAVQQNQEKTLEARALTAKIKGLNGYLQSLMQKKVRLDIEIRRTKTRLSKIKRRSQTIVKTSVQLENALVSGANPNTIRLLAEEHLPAADLQDLAEATYLAEQLLLEVEQLPLVEEH